MRALAQKCQRWGKKVVGVLFLEIKTRRQMKDSSQNEEKRVAEGRRGEASGLTNADIFSCCSPVVRSVKRLFRCLPRLGHES